jgi:hypothetical protein
MTAKTQEAALAIEAARGAEHIASIRAEGFRAGAVAMRNAALREAGSRRIVHIKPTAKERAITETALAIYDAIRSLDIPEMDR